MNSMIQTVDLTKKFNDFVANDHINLDVKEQEIKCIVGENGAGKSTMMNMLYGLLQPTSNKRKNPDPGERSYTEQPG